MKTMLVSDLIQCLQQVLAKAGDIEVVVPCQMGDQPVADVVVSLNASRNPGQPQAVIVTAPIGGGS